MSELETSAFNYESVTVSTAAIGVTASTTTGTVVKRGSRALITVEDQPIRFRYDGADPTDTEGHSASAGDQIELTGYDDINRFRAIRASTATGDAVIKATLESF